jgi:hypothetical protein
VAALSRPQTLFHYNDHCLNTLENCRVVTDTADLQGQRFDFVLLTLDGATCRSEQGVATPGALGAALADTGTSLVICGVGIGLYEHVQATTGFDAQHLLQGTMKRQLCCRSRREILRLKRYGLVGKVLAQNIQILDNCVAAGAEAGQELRATRSLLQRFTTSAA